MDVRDIKPVSLDDRPREVADLLAEELRARGMSDGEITAALRKKKRRKPLEFYAVHYKRMMAGVRQRV
jgi:hypothetical protein